MSKRVVDALGEKDMNIVGDGGRLKDMEGVTDAPFTTTFDAAAKQEQVMAGEIWFEREQDNLLDVNDASIFYSDFPPLPDFPCMSSSSSSSSAPTSAKPVAAKSSSPSASSSSSSAVSWTALKPQVEGGEKKRRHYAHYDYQADAPSPSALLSTASMEVLLPPEDVSEDVDCINVMENFGYMDLLDNNDIWGPFFNLSVRKPPRSRTEAGGLAIGPNAAFSRGK